MKRWLVFLASLALGGAAAGWWMWSGSGVDPQVTMVETRAAELFNATPKMTEEQRRAAWTEFRQSIDQLTPQQRDQLRQRRSAEFQRRDQQRLKQFFALAPAEQTRELDRRINEMQQWRQRRAQRRSQADGSGSALNRRANSSTGAARGGGGRGEGRQDRNWTGADRNERRQRYLNSTTPEYRAMRAEYARRLEQRLQQRGLAGSFGGRWR
jgi:hypothetical protein